MRLLQMNRTLVCCVVGLWLSSTALAQSHADSNKETNSSSCPGNDTGLKLPAGFCATIFADGIGHARHLVVSPSGVVYVNTWSGRYYGNQPPHPGGFLVALQDKTGAGKADVIERLGKSRRPAATAAQVSGYTRARFTLRKAIES